MKLSLAKMLATAVAAIGAGERLELLALYRDATVSSVACAKVKRHLVNK